MATPPLHPRSPNWRSHKFARHICATEIRPLITHFSHLAGRTQFHISAERSSLQECAASVRRSVFCFDENARETATEMQAKSSARHASADNFISGFFLATPAAASLQGSLLQVVWRLACAMWYAVPCKDTSTVGICVFRNFGICLVVSLSLLLLLFVCACVPTRCAWYAWFCVIYVCGVACNACPSHSHIFLFGCVGICITVAVACK